MAYKPRLNMQDAFEIYLLVKIGRDSNLFRDAFFRCVPFRLAKVRTFDSPYYQTFPHFIVEKL